MKKFNSLDYLAGLNVDVMRLGLETISELLAGLGNPQYAYKTIMVAGTNGKGSTATMIASILRSAGYRVGLYTSPHLIDVRERIMIDGKKISRKDLDRIVACIRKKKKDNLTYFEFLTATAFIYFQHKKVDIAVLEVGLGGRLDATNVCRPVVSVITNISFDHMDYLGNSLESIAREKGDIIKQNGVCVTAVKQKKVLEVFKGVSLHRKAKLYCLGSDIKMIKQKNNYFAYQGLYREISGLKIALAGEHQLANAALAIAAIEIAGKKGFKIGDEAIRIGLKSTKLAARMEVLQKTPLFVLDGAHNPAGISALCRTLKNDYSYRRLILIFSCLADKNYIQMLKIVAPLAQKIILPPLKTTRAELPDIIKETVNKMGYNAVVAKSASAAIERAQALASEKDLICATGSLYLAAEVKQKFPKTVSCGKKHLI